MADTLVLTVSVPDSASAETLNLSRGMFVSGFGAFDIKQRRLRV